MRRTTPTPIRTTKPTNKFAQQIYLRRANVATRIVAKYASNETVPTNLISGSGLKPLTNKAQQPQPPAKPQKAQASPASAAQPSAPAIDPMPANVPPPPYIPPPESGLPPGQPLAPRKQAAAPGSFDSKLDMSSVGGKSTDLSSVGGKSVAGFRDGMKSDAAAFSNRSNSAATQHVTPPPGANYTAHRRRIVNGHEVYNDTRSSAQPTWTPTAEYNARFGNPAAPASSATPPTAATAPPPSTPAVAPTTESSQTEIAPLQSPAVAPPDPGAMSIADTQNIGDSAQMPIAHPANAHSPITPPAAVNPTAQPSGQPAGQPTDQTSQNTGNQAQPAGPPRGQPAGQPTDQPTDPDQFAQDLQKMPKEQAVPKAQEFVKSELAKPENQEIMRGIEDIKSGDQQRANSPAAQAYQAAMKKAPEGLIREEYARLIQASPNATPEQQGGFMSQAINNGMTRFNEMPQGAQIMMGLGLGFGLVGVLSSLFGEGGMGGGLMGLLGLGGAGLMAANYGMFGNDARQMMGQGAIGLGRAMGMNIPGKDDFTPDGMAKRQQQVGADVQGAMNTKNDKGQRGGWAAGQQKLDQTRQPLDYLASMDEGTAITTLMGAMETNDPSVAKQQYDMLIKKRQEMLDPEFLRNQARGQMLENLPYVGNQRETVESRPVLKSLANQALNYVGYGSYPAGQK